MRGKINNLLNSQGFNLKNKIMEIIRLLKENDYDLTKILNLSDFAEGQLALMRNLILSAYNEGFEDGKATVMNDLDEFLRIKK